MDSRRTSTGSGSVAPQQGAAERYSGPSSRSVGAPVEGVCIYPFRMTPYGFPPIPPSAAEWAGAPIPSPTSENRVHFGIESHASTGTLPAPRQISSVCPNRRGSCPGAKHQSPRGVQTATKSSLETLSRSCTWVGSIDDESDEEVEL